MVDSVAQSSIFRGLRFFPNLSWRWRGARPSPPRARKAADLKREIHATWLRRGFFSTPLLEEEGARRWSHSGNAVLASQRSAVLS